MRVLVISAEPDSDHGNPESVASVLADLGCRTTLTRFDFSDLDEETSRLQRPTVAVVDAGDEMDLAMGSLRGLSERQSLAEVPRLLVLPLARVSGLNFSSGFDDFVLAPVVPAELYARLRQLDWKSASFGSDEVIKVGDLVIDVAGYESRLAGRPIDFTHQEFELLRFLAQNRGRVFTREQLLRQVWGYQYGGGTRTVDIHVRRLRAKLGSQASLIVTIRNVGYKMRSIEGGDT